MNFSEQPKVLTPNWGHHVEESKKFSGSYISYCREQKIDYDQFMYYKDKIKNKLKVERALAREVRAGFTRIKVEDPSQNKVPQQLPDAKWLSEFIYNLVRAL